MAHFYGTVQGARGEASRLGHKRDGLRTVAASWSGAIEVAAYQREDGVDCARISFRQHHGHGTSRLIYDGPISGDGFPGLRNPDLDN